MTNNECFPDREPLQRSGIFDTEDVRYFSIPGYSRYLLRVEGGDWENLEVLSTTHPERRRLPFKRLKGRLVHKAGQGRIRFHLVSDPGFPVRPSRGSLVLLAMQGPPPRPGMQALHRDDCGVNDHPENLYWGTPAENVADMGRHGWRTTEDASRAWRRVCAAREGASAELVEVAA